MPLLNKTIFSCEFIVLSYKSNEACITYYLIYDHFATSVVTKISIWFSSIPLMILLRVTLSMTLVQGEGGVLTVTGETILIWWLVIPVARRSVLTNQYIRSTIFSILTSGSTSKPATNLG